MLLFLTIALNQAVSPSERADTIQFVLRTVSHANAEVHEHELTLGIDKALCLKLGYVTLSGPLATDETQWICQSLVTIYSSVSAESRKRSFRTIGATELLPLAVRLISRTMEKHLDSKTSMLPLQPEIALLPTMQLLRQFAKLGGTAQSTLIRYEAGNWMAPILLYSFAELQRTNKATEGYGNQTSRYAFEILGLVKDLLFRAAPADKQTIWDVENQCLFRILTFFARNSTILRNLRLAEWFSAVCWNVVLDEKLCQRVLENRQLQPVDTRFPIVEACVELLSGLLREPESAKNSSIRSKIKRNCTSALGNVLMDEENQKKLVSINTTDGSGVSLPTRIFSVLSEIVDGDSDSVLRRRAMRGIRSILLAKDFSVRYWTDISRIVEFLLDRISANSGVGSDAEVHTQACQTLRGTFPYFQQQDWPRLETALVQLIETAADAKLIATACLCLVECVQHSPWSRGSSCFSDMFWNRLESSVASSKSIHDAVATLCLELVKKETRHASPSAGEQLSALTSPVILNTIAMILKSNESFPKEKMLQVILLLKKRDVNKTRLAEHELLLSALVDTCIQQPGSRDKDIAKQLILELVPVL